MVKIFGNANVFTEQGVNDDGSPRPAMSGELVPGDVVVRHPTLGYFDLVWNGAEGASAAQRSVSAAHLAHTEMRKAHENRTLGHPHLRQIRFVPIAISSFGVVAPPTVDEPMVTASPAHPRTSRSSSMVGRATSPNDEIAIGT